MSNANYVSAGASRVDIHCQENLEERLDMAFEHYFDGCIMTVKHYFTDERYKYCSVLQGHYTSFEEMVHNFKAPENCYESSIFFQRVVQK